MAASYQSGVASSPTNLLQSIVTWLASQGWTTDLSAADGSGWRAHLHKSGIYVNLRAASNDNNWPNLSGGYYDRAPGYGIGLYLGTGYSGAAAWSAQAGRPIRTDAGLSTSGCGMNLPNGSVAGYHFFDDGLDNVIVVVERMPGVYVHLGFGLTLVTLGTFEDFPYFFASSSYLRNLDQSPGNSMHGFDLSAFAPFSSADHESGVSRTLPTNFIRVDAATFSGRWTCDANQEDGPYGYTGRFCRVPVNRTATALDVGDFPSYKKLLNRGQQSAFAGAILLPLHCFVKTDPAARWAPVGYPANVFHCEAVGNGFASQEIVQVGGLDYMVFPNFAVRKAA